MKICDRRTEFLMIRNRKISKKNIQSYSALERIKCTRGDSVGGAWPEDALFAFGLLNRR